MSERISSDPNVCGGEACVTGTRVPVRIVLSHLAAGEDIATILTNFPKVTREDVKACLEYASYLASERLLAS